MAPSRLHSRNGNVCLLALLFFERVPQDHRSLLCGPLGSRFYSDISPRSAILVLAVSCASSLFSLFSAAGLDVKGYDRPSTFKRTGVSLL